VTVDDIAQRGQAVIMHGSNSLSDIQQPRRGAGHANDVAP
jgi:hypothetical protein